MQRFLGALSAVRCVTLAAVEMRFGDVIEHAAAVYLGWFSKRDVFSVLTCQCINLCMDMRIDAGSLAKCLPVGAIT